MISGTAILLVIKLVAAETFVPDQDCIFNDTVKIGEYVEFENPKWPATYMSGINCRWTFECIYGHVCHLRCPDVGLPLSEGCQAGKLLVSRSGDLMMNDAETYCGRATINTKSYERWLVVGLVSRKDGPGGRFRCKIKIETDVRIFDIVLGKKLSYSLGYH